MTPAVSERDKNEIHNLRTDLSSKEKALIASQVQVAKQENDVTNLQSKCERLEKEMVALQRENNELKDQKTQHSEVKQCSCCRSGLTLYSIIAPFYVFERGSCMVWEINMGVCPRLDFENIMLFNCLGYNFNIYGAFEFLCNSIANL